MKVLFQQDNGIVGILIPNPALSIEYVVEKDLPDGTIYEIVDDNALPLTYIRFRDAWEWNGPGNAITVSLAKSKALATAGITHIAGQAAAYAQKLELIFEPVKHSTTDIREAYQACKTTISNCTSVDEILDCYNNFQNLYEDTSLNTEN